jgi:excisionase family DNA binding protein
MDEETFYTIPEAAKKLRVTRAALYKWMKEGRLGFVLVGSERRITSSAIDAFVKAGKVDKPDQSDLQSPDIRTPGHAEPVRAAA